MGAPKQLTDDVIEEALRLHFGNYTRSAQALGCTRQNIFQRVQNSSRLLSVCVEAKEEILDIAEDNIQKSIKDGDVQTSKWLTERLGKNRGYTTRVEQTGSDGKAIETVQTNVDLELSGKDIELARSRYINNSDNARAESS